MTILTRLLVVLMALAVGQGLHAGDQDQQTTPTFRSSADAVQISVIVTDAAGNPVSGLTQDDFEIFENKEARPVSTFSAVDIPIEKVDPTKPESDVLTNDRPPGRLYVIALDDMSETNALRSRVFLRQFVEDHFGPNDSAAIVLTTRGIGDSGQEFTSSPKLLLRAIDRFTGGTIEGGGWAREKNFMGDFRALVKVMATLPAARKAIILVSSSIPGDADRLREVRANRVGRMFQGDVNPDFHDAVSMATRNNIAVYPIDPRGLTTELSEPGSFDVSAMNERSSLVALAEMTGGFALVGSNNFQAAFERLVRDNSTYYVLGFNSGDDRRTGQYTRVEVRVKRPGLTVRSLEGYLAPSNQPETVKRPKTVLTAAWDAVASPLTASGVNIRMFAAPFKSNKANLKDANIAVSLEIATNRLHLVEQDGVFKGDLEILFAITDVKNKRRPVVRHRAALALKPETYERVSKRALRVITQLQLPEGRYQLRAAAGDETFAGSVVFDLIVPDFKDDFSLSGVSVTSAQALETMTVMPQKRFDVELPGPPTTAREFLREDVLTLFVEAYENRKKRHVVTFTSELRDTAGKVVDRLLVERKSVEKPQQASVHIFAPKLPLEEVPPGQYVIHLEAKSSLSRDPVVRDVPITVR